MNILKKGLPARKELDRLQGEIADARTNVNHLEALPLHIDEVRARIAEQVKYAIHQNTPGNHFSGFNAKEATYAPVWRGRKVTVADFIALQAYLDGEERVVDRIMTRLKADEKFGDLRMEERTAKLGKLRSQIEILEFTEEREIRRLEAQGHDVIRRADAREEVLLKVWSEAETLAEA